MFTYRIVTQYRNHTHMVKRTFTVQADDFGMAERVANALIGHWIIAIERI